jgi:hypothetical protein
MRGAIVIRECAIHHESKDGKSRRFGASCLAVVEADMLWTPAQGSETMRPLWAMFVASEEALRPFVANLSLGRKAQFGDGSRRKSDRLELLKSAGYKFTWQKEAEGSIVTAFLPEFFLLDPGMVDPKGAHFVLLPSVAWLRDQQDKIGAEKTRAAALYVATVTKEDSDPSEELLDTFEAYATLAYLFAAYLDRRTRCPIPADGRFYLQLLMACLREGLASWPDGRSYNQVFGEHEHFQFRAQGTDDVGLLRPIAFSAMHEDIERILASEVTIFFERTTR